MNNLNDDAFDLDVRIFEPKQRITDSVDSCFTDDCDTCDGTECESCEPWSDDCYTSELDGCTTGSERPC